MIGPRATRPLPWPALAGPGLTTLHLRPLPSTISPPPAGLVWYQRGRPHPYSSIPEHLLLRVPGVHGRADRAAGRDQAVGLGALGVAHRELCGPHPLPRRGAGGVLHRDHAAPGEHGPGELLPGAGGADPGRLDRLGAAPDHQRRLRDGRLHAPGRLRPHPLAGEPGLGAAGALCRLHQRPLGHPRRHRRVRGPRAGGGPGGAEPAARRAPARGRGRQGRARGADGAPAPGDGRGRGGGGGQGRRRRGGRRGQGPAHRAGHGARHRALHRVHHRGGHDAAAAGPVRLFRGVGRLHGQAPGPARAGRHAKADGWV